MASPARSRSDGMGGDLSPALVKGAVLVFVALVLGVFLLAQGPDNDLDAASGVTADDDEAGDDATSDTTADGGEGDQGGEGDGAESTTDSTETTTTTEAAEARPPEEVTVLVANASGIPGAASRIGEELAADGYIVAEPDNAKEPSETTVVYYIAEFEPEAVAVAEALGLDPSSDGVVAEVPSPLPTQDENMGAAQVLVILGTDQAPTA